MKGADLLHSTVPLQDGARSGQLVLSELLRSTVPLQDGTRSGLRVLKGLQHSTVPSQDDQGAAYAYREACSTRPFLCRMIKARLTVIERPLHSTVPFQDGARSGQRL